MRDPKFYAGLLVVCGLIAVAVAGYMAYTNAPDSSESHVDEEMTLESCKESLRHAETVIAEKKWDVELTKSYWHAQRAYFLLHVGKIEEGLKQLKEVREMDKNYWKLKYYYASVEALVDRKLPPGIEEIDDPETAVELWEKMIKDSDGSIFIQSRYGRFLSVTQRQRYRNPVLAETYLRNCLKYGDYRNLLAYADVLAQLERWDEAIEYCDRALSLAQERRDNAVAFIRVLPEEHIEGPLTEARKRIGERRELFLKREKPPLSTRI